MSDLQRDIEQIESVVNYIQGGEKTRAAWQRIREELAELQAELDATIDQRDALDLEVQRLNKRLTPDRERVARAIAGALGGNPRVGELPPSWMKAADAAIDAMKETP